MFHKMPIVLLGIIFSIFLFGDSIPESAKSVIFALSLSVKSAIIFILPFIIFMLLFKTVSQLSRDATKLVILILAFVCCSNFLSTMLSYQIGQQIYNLDLSIAVPQDASGLLPSWNFTLPKVIANDVAMFGGILLGLLAAFFAPNLATRFSSYFDKAVNVLLRGLTYIVPLFIAGFILKLHHDKLMDNILRDYSVIFSLVALSLVSYISFIYLACSNFTFATFATRVKNMLPAAIAGFSSMSSAAAMPLTIIGTEKNTQNPLLSRLSIPATVNTHLVGDCFAIPIFAFAVMKNFGVPDPLFSSYLVFALYFVLAKFSVAAVPGGGILVMLPILESQLGFTAEMASLITALYILFDPVITCANVCGNGGFALVLDRLQKLLFKSAKA
jgi:Na+/H+-dicarboxylate symporter